MHDDEIKRLIKILEESSIDELEVSDFWGQKKIRLKKNSYIKTEYPVNNIENTAKDLNPMAEAENIENQSQNIDKINNDNQIIIKAPLVGTFYRSPKPDVPPFIKKGDIIKKGQIFCIIEAMKIFNEIESECSGVIKEILIEDGKPVEFGQDLLIISTE